MLTALIGGAFLIVIATLVVVGFAIWLVWYCVNSWADVFTSPSKRGKWKGK